MIHHMFKVTAKNRSPSPGRVPVPAIGPWALAGAIAALLLTPVPVPAGQVKEPTSQAMPEPTEHHERSGRTVAQLLTQYHYRGNDLDNELSEYVASLNRAAGYDEVETPHVFRTELWKKSGHYENYVDDMFLLEVNDEEYGLKPMNCPGHATIFDQKSWSYRDLPVRYFEDGKVYRKEQRGELSGLSRTWAFTIDDGHLFVRPDQIEAEVLAIMDIILDILETFELDYTVQFATRPAKSVGGDEIWE
jgi:threonyl-tRNA synthetase